MNEDIPLIPIILLSFCGIYFAYEVHKRKNRLYKIFNVLDNDESAVTGMLEAMVMSGDLKPC